MTPEIATSERTEKRRIYFWFGERQERAKWITEPVATNAKRTYETNAWKVDPDTGKRVVVRVKQEELVYAHHGYRPQLDGDKQARSDFFFRGARVWRR